MPPKRPPCHAHPDTPAVGSCARCFVPVCAVCRQHDGLDTLCADCVRKRRRAPWVRAAGVVGALAAIGGVTTWIYVRHEPLYDYGAHAEPIRRLEVALSREPCDRPKIEELLQEMLDAGDNRGVIGRMEQFFAKCGDYDRLRVAGYRAHQRLGEWDRAAAHLTVLVDAEPFNAFYRAWRGGVYRDKGDLEKAADDFRQALLLYPKATDIPLDLATVQEKQGKWCEAAFPLHQLVFHHGHLPWMGGVRERIAHLEQKGGCGAAGSGRATIRLGPGETVMRAKVRLEGREDAMFVVDSGASYVTLTRALAQKLDVKLAGAPKVIVRTAGGQRDGALALLGSVAVEGIEARQVPALVVDDLGPGLDGLLGLSFLTRFQMRQEGGVLELAAPGAPAAAAQDAGAGAR